MSDTGSVTTDNADQLLDLVNKILERLAQMQHYQVTLSAARYVKLFDGTGEASAKDWLEELERVKLVFALSDEVVLDIARKHLEKKALTWFHGISENVLTWDEFKREFETKFYGRSQWSAVNRIVTGRVQARGESLRTYFIEKLRLCQDYNLSFTEIRFHLLIGLLSHDLRATLLSRSHADVDDLWLDLSNQDRLGRQRKNTRRGKSRGKRVICNCRECRQCLYNAINCPQWRCTPADRSSPEDQ